MKNVRKEEGGKEKTGARDKKRKQISCEGKNVKEET